MHEISILIPVRDEEKNIEELVTRIFSALEEMHKAFEIIFITDVNRDNTVDLLETYSRKYPNIKSLKLSNSFGQHVAVIAGLDHCHGKYIVIMDGDLQDYPEDIPILYNKIIEGYDIVYTTKEAKNDNFFRNLSSWMFNNLMNYLSDIKIDSNSSMFRIISRKALEEVVKFREYEPSLTYIFSYINLPKTTANVRSGVRQYGKTKYSFFKLVNFAISSLLSFSRKPLRVISNFGLIVSVVSFIYFALVLYQYFFLKIEVLGWATIIVVITFIGGIQLLSIGIIGEYLGRVYMQTKNRPLYIIEKKFGDFDQ
jgi:polyisoprenyl-phosphate glycosyltransferase